MLTHRGILLAAGVAAVASFAGCTVGPDYQVPDVVMPLHFGSTKPVVVAQETLPESDTFRWWLTLHDKVLDRLVERAIACNPDIEIALTRVQEFRTQQIVVIGSALPQVGASGGIAKGTGTDLTKGRVAQSIRAGDAATGLSQINRMAGFDAGWELDLFGKYRRLLEAVRDDAEAMAEFRNAVLISVVADVVYNYVVIRALQLRLEIAQDAVDTAQKNVDFFLSRTQRGINYDLDLALARRQLGTVKARIPELQAAISDAISRLAVLLGTYSPEIARELSRKASLPRVPSRLRSGVPPDLLRRRPDIRQAERALAASTARIGVEIASLFPEVTATAGIGVQGGDPTGKTKPISGPIWSAGPGGYWPLLDFGRIDAIIDIQELRTHELFVNYKKTIIVAVEEVDNSIRQYRAQQQVERELAVALEQSRKALDLATERYQLGITNYLYVIDAERQEYEIADQHALAQEAVIFQYIFLYKALGGGWELYDELPPLKGVDPAVVATVRRLTNDWH